MKQIVKTRELQRTLLLFQAAIPIVGIEVLLCSQNPWWIVPLRPLIFWTLAVEFVVGPATLLLSKGRRWPFHALLALGVFWIALTLLIAIRLQSSAVAAFGVLILAIFGFLLRSLWIEINQSFANPRVKWFERRPSPLPGIGGCLLSADGQSHRIDLARLDEKGAYLFCEGERGVSGETSGLTLHLSILETEFKLRVQVMTEFGREQGIGVRFLGLDPDQREDLRVALRKWQRRLGI